MQKQLKRHILSFVPSAKIESMRFRSLAFQKPTTKLPTSDDESSKPGKSGRAHDRDRAANWRDTQDTASDETALKKDEKKFLRPEEKKKIAFIKGELHSSATTANAYMVFAYASPGSGPTPASQNDDEDEDGDDAVAGDGEATSIESVQLDPFEATRTAVSLGNGSTFMERTIRVDYVKAPNASTTSDDSDPKRTVFVGNLDFASKEEDLRVFFEGVVSSEIGPPPTSETSTDGTSSAAPRWVTRVRIVRDKDTQLGKGFAYVQFRVSLRSYPSL
jgi:nucleolar protein 12